MQMLTCYHKGQSLDREDIVIRYGGGHLKLRCVELLTEMGKLEVIIEHINAGSYTAWK